MTTKQTTGEEVDGQKTAIFAGGCFWCMEGPFEAEPGVIDVVVGYTGGEEVDPSYELVSSGTTKHREAIKVTYDPTQVSYERLVELYFWQIDPTDPNGQFADKGYQYTTAIYYFDEEQKQIAEQAIKDIDASGRFDKPVVTKVLAAKPFYLAEDYHQDYYLKQSAQYEAYSILSGRKGFIKRAWQK
ncbi:MAG: peptide-methionine (S)-S-oxide reductase MsrA [Nanoarchaeota archaeon]|nr:peptide-methionine (S)-S-oxide reductase MsrA [Nanoarchaeota archaeon]